MNVWLLHENSESGPKNININRNEILQDLNLEIILKSMARNDKFIYKVSKSILLNPVADRATVLYRQEVLSDCIQSYDGFYGIYEITSGVAEEIERYTEGSKRINSSNLTNAAIVLNCLEILGVLVNSLEKLKVYLDSVEPVFHSSGMRTFYNRLSEDYSYQFVQEIKDSMKNMSFLTEGGEITFSAAVGQGLKPKDIVINHLKKDEAKVRKSSGFMSLFINRFIRRNVILLEDSKLAQDARDLESASLANVAKLFTSFIRELTAFFENLRTQTAFYVGAANLQIRLTQLRIPTCMPKLAMEGEDIFSFSGLYDLSLAIYNRTRPVSNALATLNLKLYIITGANQGGKSTYLRSIGIAQLLMQNGMFVPAEYYCSGMFDGIFSHFTRREDTALNSGKLDEELSRMNRILISVTPNSLLLMNESFASTTEREGSKIAQDVVNALYENGTKIIMVTHLFEFTKLMYERKLAHTMFLSAERLPDGTRTYRIYEREPERTSYGLDLYDDIIKKL